MISFSEINITTSNNSIVEINIPKADGNTTIANQINFEIRKTITAALHFDNPDTITSESIEESITAFNEEYNTFKANFPQNETGWEVQIDGDLMYQSPEVISIAISSYINTGGAHGALNIRILNFDPKTGETIENTALFNNIETFNTLAQKYFKDATKDKDIFLDENSFEFPANIGYSEEGLVILYNPYEIGPYSTGIIQFTIPFDDINSLLVFQGS
ncbi:hypothetical protein APS56_10145 [Pseudalgibacter alginicilyticus]|uniref:DUF3298 domain-containing protein n=1 Tax=Pseudalgibacter alginicilyticus TaxID=1736674 RepID=A0A0P0CH00_9FLAO|nr:DUF3298 and DUF4163 domain-containing protein [Pseudalgibacter alginicilyticus]ALJ05458.1 hypothetical protein APS56_10145 [Pseudalgibacter alginicilyticus]